jgi:hypothetical protein
MSSIIIIKMRTINNKMETRERSLFIPAIFLSDTNITLQVNYFLSLVAHHKNDSTILPERG